MTTEEPDSEPWIIADMLPIAVAHAEAAAKAAGLSVGDWLARLIVASSPPAAEEPEQTAPSE